MNLWEPADEREALSRRYGNDTLIILRIRSGQWAIFNNERQILDIVPIEHLATQLAIHATTNELRKIPMPGTFAFEGFEEPPKGPINLDELDL
jgi:hypothetical protein